ncbi:hypothetical protein KMW28_16615 [Flammeovirga yaeyamensis]|uniref:Uncharacterized protein n=1 Tax=Flammeovirga yaeyamensis TaxID=367791 RepID=A0AAX1N5E6_9BACT|nr:MULTISPECIES: hypothetical protein [Flammeovirga]ANQ51309.1 hypothetical protein MY04_3965 [Flammeovirga sp. MY04]MBB3698364.1 hypothetical protein [Flammeovirga yaeyamensis]NMF34284.1 hypothetical protein [Flammeovirga yaeyamensis]QWG01267.1 hypothetical protein KMW28_16615 [Flammeovirga yaeyamensis]
MTKTTILTILMIPVVFLLSYSLYHSVFDTIQESEEIRISEKNVILRLKLIREAETAYFQRYKEYTGSWDTLAMFIDNDSIYNVQKREIIQPRKKNDPLYYTRTDSVRIEYDTIDAVQVREKIFPGEDFDATRLKRIPGKKGKEFTLSASTVKKGNATVAVVEVVDKYPRDPHRKESNPSPTKRLLKFGSLTEATTAGNWE